MAKLTALESLQSVIRTAAEEAQPGETSREVAYRLHMNEGLLIHGFQDQWIQEKLASLIAKYRLNVRREHDLQYQLGFGTLRRRIKSRSGRSIEWDDATISGLRQVATKLRNHQHPALPEVEKMIETMAKYTGKGKGKKQRITWGEVLQKEARKAGLIE